MFNKIRGFLQWIIGGTFTLVIAACYGSPSMGPNATYGTAKVKLTDVDGKPVPGLQVDVMRPSFDNGNGGIAIAMTNTNANRTDSNGLADYGYDTRAAYIEVGIRDVDGTNNGGLFISTNVRLTDYTGTNTITVKTN